MLDIAQPAAPQVAGALPLPHFENEDVDLCGNTLTVVNDRADPRPRRADVRGERREPDLPHDRRRAPARADRQRPRLGPHLQLRQGRLLAGVGRRRRPRRGRRPQRPERPAVARQVRVGGVAERRVQGHARHRARQHGHAVERRRRRRGRVPADREPARAAAARHDRRGGPQPLPVQRLHPPQLAAAREDAARDGGGLHRHGRGPAGRLPRPGQVRDVGRLRRGQGRRHHAAGHVGDRAERHVHRRGGRLEGAGHRQLLVALVRRQERRRGGGLVRAGRALPRLPDADRHRPGRLLHPRERLDVGGVLVADRPQRRDRLHGRRLPRRRRAADRPRRADREEGQGAGALRVVREPGPRLDLVRAAPARTASCARC